MATIIEYKNELGKNITSQQLTMLKEYIKIHKIDNVIKKEETFKNGKIIVVDYIKSPSENLSEILSSYSNDIPIHINTHFENFENYKMKYYESYKGGSIYQKGRSLYNKSDTLIFTQEISLTSNVPIVNTAKKYFHFNEDEYYEFSYHDNGNLVGMYSTLDLNFGSWRTDELDGLDGFSWSQLGSYYQNADPVVPQ